MAILLLDMCIKYTGITLAAFFVTLTVIPEYYALKKRASGAALAILLGVITGVMAELMPRSYFTVMLALYFGCVCMTFRLRSKKALGYASLSLGFSYLVHYIALALFTVLDLLIALLISLVRSSWKEAARQLVSFHTSAVGVVSIRLFVFFVSFFWLFVGLNSRRVRRIIPSLTRFFMDDAGIYLSIAVISVRMMIFVAVNMKNRADAVFTMSLYIGLLLSFMLYFWIKNEWDAAFHAAIQETELELLEKSAVEKERFLKTLRSDNERFSEVIHKDNKLIPSLVLSVKKAAEDGKDLSFTADETELLDALYQERCQVLSDFQAHETQAFQTGAAAIDAVLTVLAGMAETSGVHLTVDAQAGVSEMFGNAADRGEICLILFNLAQNALASAGNAERREAAIHIWQTPDGFWCIEVRDSGEMPTYAALRSSFKQRIAPFTKEGERHKVLLTRGNLLRHAGASLEAEESADEPYVKTVRVVFDGRNRIQVITAGGAKKERA